MKKFSLRYDLMNDRAFKLNRRDAPFHKYVSRVGGDRVFFKLNSQIVTFNVWYQTEYNKSLQGFLGFGK